ncbi:cupin domain-containing protein [Paenisporosarcina sp. NPDC076898]|uniref:cupin domain-containing protein n=1 Tax=unclassified Paenisporosarcina TaxID=2642018 RepID=UPI003D008BE4
MINSTYKLFKFEDDGTIPNNPELPVILYPGVFKQHPQEIEPTFRLNNWRNSWVDGVFDYHHYHSNAHEVLGVRSGSAILRLGGKNGETVEVRTGDVLVLPAGTGHKKIKGSADFEVVGAYAEGKEYNLKTGQSNERPHVINEINQVAAPSMDPVFGNYGQVIDRWILE